MYQHDRSVQRISINTLLSTERIVICREYHFYYIIIIMYYITDIIAYVLMRWRVVAGQSYRI